MKNVYTNIIGLLLFLVGLIIFSHAVIPHDHHYDLSCDTKHHQHHDTDHESPMHCHFLNDIVFDDVVLTSNQVVIRGLQLFFTYIFDAIIEEYALVQSSLQFAKSDNLPDYLILIKHSPTRGSPLQLV
jgi:hypothetical protein